MERKILNQYQNKSKSYCFKNGLILSIDAIGAILHILIVAIVKYLQQDQSYLREKLGNNIKQIRISQSNYANITDYDNEELYFQEKYHQLHNLLSVIVIISTIKIILVSIPRIIFQLLENLLRDSKNIQSLCSQMRIVTTVLNFQTSLGGFVISNVIHIKNEQLYHFIYIPFVIIYGISMLWALTYETYIVILKRSLILNI